MTQDKYYSELIKHYKLMIEGSRDRFNTYLLRKRTALLLSVIIIPVMALLAFLYHGNSDNVLLLPLIILAVSLLLNIRLFMVCLSEIRNETQYQHRVQKEMDRLNLKLRDE